MPLQDCHSLSKYDPFKYLFWVIQAHFKLCLKRKRTRKCKFSGYKIFLKQYFGLNFRSKVKQEPKSMESNIHKRLNFRGSWALVWINAMGMEGGKEREEIENWWLGQIAPPPSWKSWIRHCMWHMQQDGPVSFKNVFQIVCTLWLAIKPFYISICKHGSHTESSCGVLPGIYLAVTQFL